MARVREKFSTPNRYKGAKLMLYGQHCSSGKCSYRSKQDARKDARRIASDCGGSPYQEYQCRICGLFHLTSQGQRRANP
jgi:hypothetical protein